MTVLQAKTDDRGDSYHPGQLLQPPPLKTGDCMDIVEFEHRYEAMPHVKMAELIEGVVYMGSPISLDHSDSHGDAMGWLGMYSFATPGVRMACTPSYRLDMKNEFQPDALLRIESGGGSFKSRDNYLEGAPELAAEISVSSASKDLNEKKAVYQRRGVQEYIVWQVRKKRLDWFELKKGQYQPQDENGVIHSRVFPGLRLHVNALLNGDLAGVSAELQKGLHTEEHAEFVRKLKP